MKIARTDTPDGVFPEFVFDCPGCGNSHGFKTSGAGPCWTFNGDMENPTISPSILVNGTLHLTNPNAPRCHSFVKDGKIQFLSDCSHSLAGQTVEIPETDW